MDKQSLFELSDVLVEQARKVKDVKEMFWILELGLDALDEDNCMSFASTLRVVRSYMETIYQELINRLEEMEKLIREGMK